MQGSINLLRDKMGLFQGRIGDLSARMDFQCHYIDGVNPIFFANDKQGIKLHLRGEWKGLIMKKLSYEGVFFFGDRSFNVLGDIEVAGTLKLRFSEI